MKIIVKILSASVALTSILSLSSTVSAHQTTYTELVKIPLYDDPMGMAYAPVGPGVVYVANNAYDPKYNFNVSVINAKNNRLIKNIVTYSSAASGASVLGQSPYDVIYDPYDGTVYVTNDQQMTITPELSIISPLYNKVMAFGGANLYSPQSLVAGDNDSIYVNCGDRIAVVDQTTAKIKATIKPPFAIDDTIAYGDTQVFSTVFTNPDNGYVYAFDANNNKLKKTIYFAHKIAVKLIYNNHRLYVISGPSDAGLISVINTQNDKLIKNIAGFSSPYDASEGNGNIYILAPIPPRGQTGVVVFNESTDKITSSAPLSDSPDGNRILFAEGKLFVDDTPNTTLPGWISIYKINQ